MKSENTDINASKRIAYLLRHDKEAFDEGRIDMHGWRMVTEIIELGFSRQQLDRIVASNNKQRFEYSADGLKIRARQGHSIPVDVELKEMTPPDFLYHGTTTKNIDFINKTGILPCRRLYVHLSTEKNSAIEVGSRHGSPHIIKIDCKRMVKDGCKFWLSNNGVWLTKKVLPKYFID